MKRMKAWQVYLDDGYDAIKVIVPAATKNEAIEYCDGNGEVVAIREYKGAYDDNRAINLSVLDRTLSAGNWGDEERLLILRTLERATEFTYWN